MGGKVEGWRERRRNKRKRWERGKEERKRQGRGKK